MKLPVLCLTAQSGVWGRLGARPEGGCGQHEALDPPAAAPQGCRAVLSSVSASCRISFEIRSPRLYESLKTTLEAILPNSKISYFTFFPS